MTIHATIYMKDGTKDWIDPVIEVIETEQLITIVGFGLYKHEFDKDAVDHIEYTEVEG